MRRIRKMCYYLGICFILCVCGGCREKERITLQEVTEPEYQEKENEPSSSGGTGKEEIRQEVCFVYVCGAVRKPGVYELPAESRVYEAVEAAGGMTDEAEKTALNLAEQLSDGQQIYVPTEEEAKTSDQPVSGNAAAAGNDGKINLNTASKEELMTLPGIGEAKADSIVRYRETNGDFRSSEELMKIEGIKDGIFNRIKDRIKVK